MQSHAALTRAMIRYEAGCPQRVQHFLKVHAFAKAIAELEGVEKPTLAILEAAAIVHDIGIRPSLAKYDSADGQRQQIEGPPVAQPMLEELGYSADEIERICHLIAHHHTYSEIEGMDYQILVEADFLVNIHEGGFSREQIQAVYDNIFRTTAGKEFCRELYASTE